MTDEGITVTSVAEPLMSAYGREMRPGATSVYALPWDEIDGVSLSAMLLPPDGERWVDLTVDVISGEYVEVHEDAEGFTDAVRKLCRLSGLPVPDSAALTTDGLVIWPPSGPS
ncbi:hypothetical protein [Asanoa iriomotensis]|uniref:hypothetical protein n=1 Tax=Asanoa iriomotensis TaxID=234613 RepID=UPI001944A8B2|nr:hypothetical protein [Asanoa iriomotensis]